MTDPEIPELDPTEAEASDWILDHEREITQIRARLAEDLATATDAVRRASQACADLVEAYDVEVAEGPGQNASDVLGHVVITLAGVRAVTIGAGDR